MQHILGLVRRCVEDYHMIDAGRHGGCGRLRAGRTALLTLTALAQLRCFYPQPFSVHAITHRDRDAGDRASTRWRSSAAVLDVPYYADPDAGLSDRL